MRHDGDTDKDDGTMKIRKVTMMRVMIVTMMMVTMPIHKGGPHNVGLIGLLVSLV